MKNIEKIFEKFLHNKFAYVTIGGVRLEGGTEQKCKLVFTPFFGLKCMGKLEFNNTNVADIFDKEMVNNRDNLNISYDQRDAIIETIKPIINEIYITLGYISPYNIKTIVNELNEGGDIINISIIYNCGSILSIKCITDDC